MGQSLQTSKRTVTITSTRGTLEPQQCLDNVKLYDVINTSNFRFTHIKNCKQYFVRASSRNLWNYLRDNKENKVKVINAPLGTGKSATVLAYLMDVATNQQKTFLYLQNEENSFLILKKLKKDQNEVQTTLFSDQKFNSDRDFLQFMKDQIPLGKNFLKEKGLDNPYNLDYVIIDGTSDFIISCLYHYLRSISSVQIIFISSSSSEKLQQQLHDAHCFEGFYSWTYEEYQAAISLSVFDLDMGLNEEELRKRHYYAGGCLSLLLKGDVSEILEYFNNLVLRVNDISEVIECLIALKTLNYADPKRVECVNKVNGHPFVARYAVESYDVISAVLLQCLLPDLSSNNSLLLLLQNSGNEISFRLSFVIHFLTKQRMVFQDIKSLASIAFEKKSEWQVIQFYDEKDEDERLSEIISSSKQAQLFLPFSAEFIEKDLIFFTRLNESCEVFHIISSENRSLKEDDRKSKISMVLNKIYRPSSRLCYNYIFVSPLGASGIDFPDMSLPDTNDLIVRKLHYPLINDRDDINNSARGCKRKDFDEREDEVSYAYEKKRSKEK
eukprot:gene10073-10948_t